MKTKHTQMLSAAISIVVFLSLYLLAYIFFGVFTGECGSTTRRWVGNFETVMIAIFSILAGNSLPLIKTRICRK